MVELVHAMVSLGVDEASPDGLDDVNFSRIHDEYIEEHLAK